MFLACAATIVEAETYCFMNRFEVRFENRFEGDRYYVLV